MDTKGNKILNRLWGRMWQKRHQFDPPTSFRPQLPIEPPPGNVKVGYSTYTVGGTVSEQGKTRHRYRNPVIKQSPSTDPAFNHALRHNRNRIGGDTK